MNYGTLLLKPYTNSIINHIERIVLANMSKKQLPTKPLKVLAHMGYFAYDNSQEQCQKIIHLFIPYMVKNRKLSEDSEVNILNSINHLLNQVGNVGNFLWWDFILFIFFWEIVFPLFRY